MFSKKVIIPVLILLALSCVIYAWIHSLPEMTQTVDSDIEIGPQTGEAIFWGKGRCHVCHRVGERGYALRGPNLGDGKEGPIIGLRAQNRARELGLSTASAYLIQTIAQPGSFVVPGYKNEMPEVFKAPIALQPAEIEAVVLYLESLGGHPDQSDIHLPKEVFQVQRTQKSDHTGSKGNVARGRHLFFDANGPAGCAACHVATNAKGHSEGGDVGPDLNAIASIRTPDFILREILNPDSLIMSKYETILIKTRDGQLLTGIVAAENDNHIVLRDNQGNEQEIDQSDIVAKVPQHTSMMPGNYEDLLSQTDLEDLLAYLLSLTGK